MKLKLLYLIVCLAYFNCAGQTYFDKNYKTGYNNLLSSNILCTPDSGCVFVNYIRDSVTGLQDLGLIRLDKQGNEVVKRSFNMLNYDYSVYFYGMKQFIEATPCSYFNSGGTYINNTTNPVIISKINRITLDTMKNVVFTTPNINYYANNFIKFNDNKYFLIGNKSNTTHEAPFIFQLDSNLTITNIINVPTSNDFACFNAIYNPVKKKILLEGYPIIGQYPITFIEIDTLGVITNTYSSVSSFTTNISQVFYSAFDTSYVCIGAKVTSKYGNNTLAKLCITKYNMKLNMLWQKIYGEEALQNGFVDAVILNDGSIVASGIYSKLTSLPLLNANPNGVILKTDKNGNLKWMKEYDHYGPGNFTEGFYGIDKSKEGGFYLSGAIMSLPKAKAWAVKTDSEGCVIGGCASSTITVDSLIIKEPVDTSSTVDLKKIISKDYGFSLFPNPAQDFLDIKFNSQTDKLFELQMTDLSGRKLESVEFKSELNLKINTSEYSPGIYFISLCKDGISIETKKLIIVR